MNRARPFLERLDSPQGMYFLLMAISVPTSVMVHDVFSPDVFDATWAAVGFVIGVLAIAPYYSATGRRIERRIYESLRLRIAVNAVLVAAFAAAFWLLDGSGATLDVGAYTMLPGTALGSVLAELLRRRVPRFTDA